MGISVHTGWGACVVVGGSLSRPEIVANSVIDILGDSERFCFHMAAEMKLAAAEKWIADARKEGNCECRASAFALLGEKRERVRDCREER
jgi:hypothetical protein